MTRVDRYEFHGTVRDLVGRFEHLAGQDRQAERLRKLSIGILILGVIGGFVAVAGEWPAPAGIVLGLAAVAAVLGGIAGIVVCGRCDLPNRRIATALQFLRIVAADTPSAAPISVTIDFRGYEVAPKAAAGDGKLAFSQTWLAVEGALADGNRYRIAVTEDVSRKTRRKRKYTKIKDRVRGSVDVQVRLKPSLYGDAEPIAQALRVLSPPHGLVTGTIVARERVVRATLGGPPAVVLTLRNGTQTLGTLVDGHTLLRTMLWVYEGIARGARPGQAA